MSFVLKIVAVLLLADLLWWWFGDRLLARAGWRKHVRVSHAAFLVLQLIGLLAVIASRRSELAMPVPQVVMAAVYLWHLLVLPVLVPLMLVGLLVALLWWLVGKLRAHQVSTTADRSELEGAITRRGFLAATAVLAPTVLTVSLTTIALRQLEQFRIRRFTISLPNLPTALDGLTIAHVSDLHAGRFTKGEVLRQIPAAVNDLRADLVLVTGDLINGALHEIPDGVDTVRRFEARSGVYMIEGNHDLFQGREAFASRIRAAGIPLLVNQTAQLTVRDYPVELLGLRWGAPGPFRSRPRSDEAAINASMDELLALRNVEAFPILLAHHPHAFDRATEAKLPLTLAGHTHGGQLMLNSETGFGPMLFRYWSGLYTRGASNLVVSNGVGNWFPLRTSAPAEIIHLKLRRA